MQKKKKTPPPLLGHHHNHHTTMDAAQAALDAKDNVIALMQELRDRRAPMEKELLLELATWRSIWGELVDDLVREMCDMPEDYIRSAEYCDRLARAFVMDDTWNINTTRRQALEAKLIQHSDAVYQTYQLYDSFRLYTSRDEFKRYWAMFDKYRNEFDWDKRLTRQTGLELIMRRCPEENRHEFWDFFLEESGRKVRPRKTLNPVRDSQQQLPEPGPEPPRLCSDSTASRLPLEILGMIYAAADLETCVIMRQVCSAWYHLFQEVDFRPKLIARNPWMKPQDDLGSWTDCVLVFVARLENWKVADSVNDIHVLAKRERQHALLAFAMKQDEKLPHNFTSMGGEFADDFASEHIQLPRQGMEPFRVRNQRTLEDIDVAVYPVVLAEDDDKTVVQCGGDLQVSLPPSIKSQDIVLSNPVTLTESYVALLLENNQWYALPRDSPHFANGLQFTHNWQSPTEIGGVLVNYVFVHATQQVGYEFADFETKQMIEYGPAALEEDPSHPVASYNGAIWWTSGSAESLVSVIPTFMDLASPDRVYYQPHAAVTCLESQVIWQGSRARDSAQFLLCSPTTRHNECAMQIIDMARGTTTNVIKPPDLVRRQLKTFVGFVGHGTGRKFQARVLDLTAFDEE